MTEEKLLSKKKPELEYLGNSQPMHVTNTQKVCPEELNYHSIKNLWEYMSRNTASLNQSGWRWNKK